MTELLKAEQPTLKVADETEGELAIEQGLPASPAEPPEAAKDACSSNEARQSLPLGDNSTNANLPGSMLGIKQPCRSNGLQRHRLIVGCCVAVSSIVLGLSVLDLKSIIGSEAKIDPTMKISAVPARPVLGPNLQYLPESKFSEGLHPVSEATWQGARIGYVNESGAVVIPPTYHYGCSFQDGLAAVAPVDPLLDGAVDNSPGDRSRRWIYINKSGKAAFPGEFSEADGFSNGVAAVGLDRGTSGALINTAGKVISPRLFSKPRYLRNGKTYLAEGMPHRFGVLSPEGKWLLPPEYREIRVLPLQQRRSWYQDRMSMNPPSTADNYRPDEYLAIHKGSLWGVADLNGKILIPPQYEKIMDFNKGWANIIVDGQYGFVSTSGERIEPRFDFATPYGDLIAVKTKGKWHFMDPSGKVLAGPGADGIIIDTQTRRWFNNGRGAVIKNGKVGFVDVNGKLVIPAQFEFAQPFSNGYSGVLDKGYWHYMDTSGRMLPQKFTALSPLSAGETLVRLPGPLYEFAEADDMFWDSDAAEDAKKFWSTTQYNPDREYDND